MVEEALVAPEPAVKSEEPQVKKPKKKKKKTEEEAPIPKWAAELLEDGPVQGELVEKKKKRKERKGKKEKAEAVETAETEEVVEAQQEETENVQPEEVEEEEGAGFTVLEEVDKKKAVKVVRVLPNWLAKPSVISCDLGSKAVPAQDFPGLHKAVRDALRRNRIQHLFPVQQQVIPFLLDSRATSLCRPSDVCVSAPTGSGKTLAFVLPTVQVLSRETVRQLRCLVVLPVHDLAVQVHRVYSSYCAGTRLRVALVAGESSFAEEQQALVRVGRTGRHLAMADVVVCTPGRLVDHLQRTAGLSLAHLRYLVIDEADRIMDETANDWLYHFEKAVGRSGGGAEPLVAASLMRPARTVQKLLFSATLSQDPEKLTRLGLFQPRLFTSVVSSTQASQALDEAAADGRFVGKYTTPAELSEHTLTCPSSLKPLAVHHLVSAMGYKRTLCFTSSLAATHRLQLLLRHLPGDVRVAECSSRVDKASRRRLLADFSAGRVDVLVCTDAVARGMDLGRVDCVLSYDPPKFVKNYIHRIGRTARAGRPGTAITLLDPSEKRRFEKLLEHAEKKTATPLELDVAELAVYEEDFRKALQRLKSDVKQEHQEKTMSSAQRRRLKTKRPQVSKKKVVASSVTLNVH